MGTKISCDIFFRQYHLKIVTKIGKENPRELKTKVTINGPAAFWNNVEALSNYSTHTFFLNLSRFRTLCLF